MNELTQAEAVQIEGGVIPVVPALIWLSGVLVGVVISNVADNWSDFKKGVLEGYNSTVAAN